jgi:hypothetical protein
VLIFSLVDFDEVLRLFAIGKNSHFGINAYGP